MNISPTLFGKREMNKILMNLRVRSRSVRRHSAVGENLFYLAVRSVFGVAFVECDKKAFKRIKKIFSYGSGVGFISKKNENCQKWRRCFKVHREEKKTFISVFELLFTLSWSVCLINLLSPHRDGDFRDLPFRLSA